MMFERVISMLEDPSVGEKALSVALEKKPKNGVEAVKIAYEELKKHVEDESIARKFGEILSRELISFENSPATIRKLRVLKKLWKEEAKVLTGEVEKPISIRLSLNQIKELDKIAKKRGVSRSKLIRDIISEFLAKETGRA